VYLIAPEPDLELTYRQLREDVRLLGKSLVKMGMKKGDKIALMMPNGYQSVKLFLAVMYAGMTAVPINLRSQPSHLKHVLEHCDARLVFVHASEIDRLKTATAKIDRNLKVVVIDIDAPDIFQCSGQPASLLPDVKKTDDALLLYTSGTTGKPKGVILAHCNLIAGAQYTTLAHELKGDDRTLCVLPLYHINAEVVSVLAPLLSGGSVVMPHRFSVSSFWSLLSRYRCTWFSAVPTIISYLVSAYEIGDKNYRLNQVRFGRSASSALPPCLHRAFEEKFGISVIETMGLTETAGPVFSNPINPTERKYGSVGKPFGNIAKIIDRYGNEAPAGTIGEIMIRGENVMKEYYKAPEITAQALGSDGWLHTGDLGYRDRDGFYFITGRLKELIIKGGENISPREIDEVLYAHPGVIEAAAVGIPDKHYGQEIIACVALRPTEKCTESELLDHCRRQLGDFKSPKAIWFLSDLPKGHSGKIQRLGLLEKLGYK